MKRLLILLLSVPVLVFAQADMTPGILILKVKPSLKAEMLRSGVQWEGFGGLDALRLRQMFPRAEEPKGRTDRHGNPFVDLTRTFRLDVAKDTDLMAVIVRLEATGAFEWVEPTTRSESFNTPNDPQIGSQNYLTQIGAFDAWAVTEGDTNVVIGVTDTSFDILHEDLQGNVKYNYEDPIDGIDNDGDGFIDNYAGWDIVDNDNNLFLSGNYHGTGVLAVSSATTDNGIGIAGVGFNCKYLPVKIGNNAGVIATADGYEAITYCADRGCKVINCSWGTTTFSNLGQDVVNYATFNMDALVVAAAGNQAVEEFRYPASFAHALSVTGVHNNDVFNNGSNPTFTYSDSVDLCAQGFNVFSTATLGSTPGTSPIYTTTGGTSYAAPQVSGAAALVRSQFPCLSAVQTAELIIGQAVDIETVGTNSDYAGKIGRRLDMAAALTPAVDPCDLNVVIDQANAQPPFSIYPNPTTAEFTLQMPTDGSHLLQVTDALGRRVLEQVFTGSSFTVTGLAPGLYTVSVDDGTHRSVQRLVVSGR